MLRHCSNRHARLLVGSGFSASLPISEPQRANPLDVRFRPLKRDRNKLTAPHKYVLLQRTAEPCKQAARGRKLPRTLVRPPRCIQLSSCFCRSLQLFVILACPGGPLCGYSVLDGGCCCGALQRGSVLSSSQVGLRASGGCVFARHAVQLCIDPANLLLRHSFEVIHAYPAEPDIGRRQCGGDKCRCVPGVCRAVARNYCIGTTHTTESYRQVYVSETGHRPRS